MTNIENQHDTMIRNEDQYRSFKQTLSKKKRPARILRVMMNALESYRGARKIGWSRPWNKYGLTVFQTFKLDHEQLASFADIATDIIDGECLGMPSSACEFCRDLLSRREELMGFIFVHEFTNIDGRHFEGATLSLGRRHKRQYRDRLDLIVEAEVDGEKSNGISRLRLFVDPFHGTKDLLWSETIDAALSPRTRDLFSGLSAASWDWAHSNEYLWDHWTSAYIDYFGPRQWPMRQSSFYVEGAGEARVVQPLNHQSPRTAMN